MTLHIHSMQSIGAFDALFFLLLCTLAILVCVLCGTAILTFLRVGIVVTGHNISEDNLPISEDNLPVV